MGAQYSSYVKSIETHARAFSKVVIFYTGTVFDNNITEIVQKIISNLSSNNYAYDTFMKIDDSCKSVQLDRVAFFRSLLLSKLVL